MTEALPEGRATDTERRRYFCRSLIHEALAADPPRLSRASSCRPKFYINKNARSATAPTAQARLRSAEFSMLRILPTVVGGPNIPAVNSST